MIRKCEWWKFWNPQSGMEGGLILGGIFALIFGFVFGWGMKGW